MASNAGAWTVLKEDVFADKAGNHTRDEATQNRLVGRKGQRIEIARLDAVGYKAEKPAKDKAVKLSKDK